MSTWGSGSGGGSRDYYGDDVPIRRQNRESRESELRDAREREMNEKREREQQQQQRARTSTSTPAAGGADYGGSSSSWTRGSGSGSGSSGAEHEGEHGGGVGGSGGGRGSQLQSHQQGQQGQGLTPWVYPRVSGGDQAMRLGMGDFSNWGLFQPSFFDWPMTSMMNKLGVSSPTAFGHAGGFDLTVPSIDLNDRDREYELSVDLPGVPRDQIKVDVTGRKLTVSAEKREEVGDRGFSRKSFGSFTRSLVLPDNADVEKISASYDHGQLKMIVPKQSGIREETRKIAIGTGTGTGGSSSSSGAGAGAGAGGASTAYYR